MGFEKPRGYVVALKKLEGFPRAKRVGVGRWSVFALGRRLRRYYKRSVACARKRKANPL